MDSNNLESSTQQDDAPLTCSQKSWRNLVAYWILGLCNNYGYVVMLTAANDIIAEQEGNTPVST